MRTLGPRVTAAELAGAVEELGVRCLAVSPSDIRLVTHLDVDPSAVREVPRRFREALRSLLPVRSGTGSAG